MISYLIKLSIRIFKKQKTITLLNLLGLSLGLCSTFIILLYVLDEFRYDHFHENKANIYRILNEKPYDDWIEPKAPMVLSEYIEESIPEIEKTTSIGLLPYAQIKKDDEFIRASNFRTTNNHFFEIFSFKFLEGDPKNALTDIHSVVLTASMAALYFPGEKAMGKTLELEHRGLKFLLNVSGVIQDIPKLSTITANFIGHNELSLLAYEREKYTSDIRTSWHKDFYRTYVLLRDGAKKETVEEKFGAIASSLQDEEFNYKFSLQALTDMHLYSSHLVNAGRRGDLSNVLLFSGIGLTILVLACFNYVILSIGQSSARAKEIGIRKVIGAKRENIVFQFLLQSIIMSFLALMPALVMVELLLPILNQMFRMSIELDLVHNPWLIGLFASVSLLVALISGGHIALVLSKLNPIKVLNMDMISSKSQILFQKSLITIQIFVFVSLVSATLVIFKQIQFSTGRNQGFDLDNLATMRISRRAIVSNFETFKNELIKSPYIKNVTGGSVIPPTNNLMTNRVQVKDKPGEVISLEGMGVDFDFITTLNLEMAQGRDFFRSNLSDSSTAIINESAVKALNFRNPIGEMIQGMEVIGVLKDFHLHSSHSKIPPLQLNISPAKYINEYLIRYEPGYFIEAQDHCKAVLSKMAPDSDFAYNHFSDALGNLYGKESRLSSITLLFGGFAIVIAILGLFGHSIFAAKRKTREIGIRKAYGARSRDILKLFGSDFLILVIIANVLSWFSTNYVMNIWLHNFAYKTNIGGLLLLVVFVLSVIIVGISVLAHTLKVSRLNPTAIFRHE